MHNIGSEYDSHTRVSYRDNPGFFGQIQQSFGATLIGILLAIISFPVIYWNEVRAMTPSDFTWILFINFFFHLCVRMELCKS